MGRTSNMLAEMADININAGVKKSNLPLLKMIILGMMAGAFIAFGGAASNVVVHGIDNAAEEVLIYGNPCTMQIILEHWTDVRLKSPAKKVNASVIKEFTGVENYKGRADQRKEIMKHITVENYQDMYTRICKMQNDDTVIGSSNFDKLVKYLSSDDDWWISEINKKLEE